MHQLCRNDANKRLMVEQGVLPLLLKGMKSDVESERNGRIIERFSLFHGK